MEIACSICQESYNAMDKCSATKCGHLFHSICLASWIQGQKTCPTCRAPTTRMQLTRIYLNASVTNSIPNQDEIDKAELQRSLKMSQDSVVQLKADVVSLKKKLQKANNSAVHVPSLFSGIMSPGTGLVDQLIRNTSVPHSNTFPFIVQSETDTDMDSEDHADDDDLYDDSTGFDTDEDYW